MRSNEALPQLIDEIHDAALDAGAWPRVLERLATAFGASSAHLATQDTAMRNGTMVSFGSDPVYAQRYADYYVSRNVLWQRTMDMPQGHVVTDRMIMPREELRRSEFFNDFLRPQDGEEILVSKALRRQHRSTVVTLWRPAAAGSWQDEHVATLTTLTPHLCQALRVNLRIGELQTSRDGAHAALDRLGDGVMIVDGEGKILFANSHASRALLQSDGVCCDRGRLRASASQEQTVLRHLIAHAARGHGGAPQSGLTRLTRPSGQRALVALVAPVPCARSDLAAGRPGAIVVLVDPESRFSIAADHLRQLYGLTAAEAAVAAEAVRGGGVAAISTSLSISRSTVRTHLIRIFEKTGTRRQAELVHKLLSSAAGLSF